MNYSDVAELSARIALHVHQATGADCLKVQEVVWADLSRALLDERCR